MTKLLTPTARHLPGALFLSCLLWLQPALAADPLVNVAWLKDKLGQPGMAVLDVQQPTDYLKAHIPGAVHTDFDKSGWREERTDKVPDMLPTDTTKLVTHIGSLGIDQATHVVLVAPGKNNADMGWATRIYWTFKVLGHDQISILNGGMAAWAKDKANPVQAGAVKAEAKSFTVKLRGDMVPTASDVKAAMARGVTLVDNRPEDQFVGINRNPKASQNGTLPGAKNLPSNWTSENAGGLFRSKAQIEQLYQVAGVPTSGEQVNFCNTGHLASIGWFVSSEILGNKQARLYDGSMTEWTLNKVGPVEQKVKLQ
jgi:thiosulfate/3-mercaptopyruvate sulfurtransferase